MSADARIGFRLPADQKSRWEDAAEGVALSKFIIEAVEYVLEWKSVDIERRQQTANEWVQQQIDKQNGYADVAQVFPEATLGKTPVVDGPGEGESQDALDVRVGPNPPTSPLNDVPVDDPPGVFPSAAPGMTDLMISPEAIDEALATDSSSGSLSKFITANVAEAAGALTPATLEQFIQDVKAAPAGKCDRETHHRKGSYCKSCGKMGR